MAGAVSDKTLALFNRYLVKHLGLHFAPPRLRELEQKMVPAARELGHQEVEPCMVSLMAGSPSARELEVLARFLTIGETYFLRDPESYRVLEEELLPALVYARRKGEKTLRIWSAGCSSGEEAYSIAILLERLIPDLASWDVRLCATDVNEAALAKARLGVYGKWSFRNAPEWLFSHLVQRSDGRHEVPPRLKRLVRFSRLNLVSDDYSALFPEGSVDIVFCRNVMLYFDQELRCEVVRRFHTILADGGWLFVGPAEVDHRIFADFSCRRFSGALVFMKGHGGDLPVQAAPQQEWVAALEPFEQPIPEPSPPQPPPVTSPAPTPAPAQQEAVPLQETLSRASAMAAAGRHQEAVGAAHAALALQAGHPDALEILAKSYASLGRVEEARRYCEEAIAADRLRAENYYLLSIILEEQGLVTEAAASLKRTLYLDQDFLLAHFALGKLDRQAGRSQESRRHFLNALRLLERRESHEVLSEAAGLTAGRLAEIIRALDGGIGHV